MRKKNKLNSVKKALISQGFFIFEVKFLLNMKLSCSPLVIALLISGLSAVGQNSVLGKWKSVDDKTGETKSIVELYEVDGKIFGRVVKIFPGPNEDQDPICNQCPSDDTRYKKR